MSVTSYIQGCQHKKWQLFVVVALLKYRVRSLKQKQLKNVFSEFFLEGKCKSRVSPVAVMKRDDYYLKNSIEIIREQPDKDSMN